MGYDISDYKDIDPRYGTLADVDELVARLGKLGMKLMMDLVVNHTSDQVGCQIDDDCQTSDYHNSIIGSSNHAPLAPARKGTGTSGSRVGSTMMARSVHQTIGVASWIQPNQHGSGMKPPKSTTYPYSPRNNPT